MAKVMLLGALKMAASAPPTVKTTCNGVTVVGAT